MGSDRQFYLRPPRIRPKAEPRDTPLKRDRDAILGDWADHGAEMHGYGGSREDMPDIRHILHECPECADFMGRLRESEQWTEETRPGNLHS